MVHHWPALVLAIILGTYWARVVKLALKARRRTGRAGNLVPGEPLGRGLRVLWAPVVLAWVAHPALNALAEPASPLLRPCYRQPVVEWLAVFVAALAFGATLACWRRMGKSWRMGIDPGEKTPLVLTGPYAYVRHPIYALSQLLMIASVVALPTPLMILLGLLHLFFLQWEARREEAHLIGVHGPTYAEYRARVGRFVPRPTRPST